MPPPKNSPPMPWPAPPQNIHTTIITTTSSACCDAGPRRDAMQGTGVMRVATYNIGAKTDNMFSGKSGDAFKEKLKKDFLQLQAVVA
jgi:hypothetical protein